MRTGDNLQRSGPNINRAGRDSIYTFLFFFLLSLSAYHFIFFRFFPNQNSRLGHDYSYFLPNLLNGYYWFLQNGLWKVPWFTPAFCGGLPFFPNPQSIYYSLPQLLTTAVNPLFSVYITFILFASLGFIGFYSLLRGPFKTSPEAAGAGAAMFMFNGFYAHRLIIGHLTFHSFMLIPLLACLLLSPSGDNSRKKGRTAAGLRTLLAGIMLAYMFNSGAAVIIIPALLSIIGIWAMFMIRHGAGNNFCRRFMASGLIAICLAAAKLASSLAFLQYFPRDMYNLPGVPGPAAAFNFVFRALFVGPGDSLISLLQINNSDLYYGRHEFEFGITVIPLIIILAGAAVQAGRSLRAGGIAAAVPGRWPYVLIFSGIILLPVCLNILNPAWSSFLKSLPYIKNSSSLTRWIAIDIPLLVLSAALVLEQVKKEKIRYGFALLAMLLVIVINSTADRTYYQNQPYNPAPVISAYYQARENGRPPPITRVVAIKAITYDSPATNDLLIAGCTQVLCNEPMFDYEGKNFPIKNLRPGKIDETVDGVLNIKNPACFLFGPENRCEPGDHFRESEIEQALAFASYLPFAYEISFYQLIANRINSLALFITLVFFIIIIGGKIVRLIKPRQE